MEEAIQMARRIGDPITIASALTAAESALHAPHTAPQRLANAGEIVALATAAGDRERLFDGHEHAFWASWELGDPDRRARELAAMTRVAEDLRQPAQLWMLAAARATFALAQGHFARGPGADPAGRARSVRDVLAWNAGAARTLQRFLLCRERGELADYLHEVVDHEDAFPSPLVHGSVLAQVYARLGRARGGGGARARAHAPRSCGTGTSTSSGSSASACSRRPAWRWRSSRPWPRCTTSCCATAGRTRSPCPSWRWTPPAARSASWRPRSAASRTRSATSGSATLMNERMAARPWVAHTRFEHARMLLRRDGDGDRERAAELLRLARATYRELGMQEPDRDRRGRGGNRGGAAALGATSVAQARAGSNSERLTNRPWPGCETTLPPS